MAPGAAFPWFLIHRELALATRDGATSARTLSAADVLDVGLLAMTMLTSTFVAFTR